MRTLIRMTVMTLVIFSAIVCLAQLGAKKHTTICKKCQQEAKATVTPDAEDFSLIGLLTIKFM